MSCFGLLPLMRFDDTLNSNREKIVGRILPLNRQFDQFAVTQTDPLGNVC
jgi:hypothetical protein